MGKALRGIFRASAIQLSSYVRFQLPFVDSGGYIWTSKVSRVVSASICIIRVIHLKFMVSLRRLSNHGALALRTTMKMYFYLPP